MPENESKLKSEWVFGCEDEELAMSRMDCYPDEFEFSIDERNKRLSDESNWNHLTNNDFLNDHKIIQQISVNKKAKDALHSLSNMYQKNASERLHPEILSALKELISEKNFDFSRYKVKLEEKFKDTESKVLVIQQRQPQWKLEASNETN